MGQVLRIGVLISFCLLLPACGGAPTASVEQLPDSNEEEETGVKKMKEQSPDVPPKRCSVKDSNGPLEGGERTTSGCAEDEICVCETQAGYSCSGFCRKSVSVGPISGHGSK